MIWRVRGIEQGATRRPADVGWDEDGPVRGLVVEPGSEWIVEQLRAIDGERWTLGPSGVTPAFTVDLGDPDSAFWTTISLLRIFEMVEGTAPEPFWQEEPEGVVN